MEVNRADAARKPRKTRPLSPCTLICTLDDDQRCLGCGRTLQQISQWSLLSSAEQWAIIDQLAAEGDAIGATIDAINGD